ncbi:unnamed protein product, partial [Heligmosomoides polygyrus]|uniref:CRAL-TRIO domain-containing protein n=1 Tax=Heligmosomoides polygyrus TaxID=6339 RepID=A0A183FIP1_HELPZ
TIEIESLRKLFKLTPYYDTDFNLLRWLKGHDNNLEVIVPKLTNHLLLRKKWDLDTLPDKPRNHPVHQHWKSGLTGEAILTPNCIVNIEQTGGNDYWGMMNTHPINEILRARMHDLENMLRSVMELEKKTALDVMLSDLLSCFLVSGGLASISAFMAENYVEMIHSFVLVNVPNFISAIWTVARPLLPERTRNKVNILDSQWKEDILKLADAHCLPSYWNEKGQEGPFLAPIERGVEYPPEKYYKGEIPEKAEILQIAAGKSGYFDVEAREGSRLTWELHSNGHFAFAIYELDKEGDSEDTANLNRFYPHFSKIPGPTLVPLLDAMPVTKTGTYRFWFGNTHAWFHTLKIHYVVETKS